MALFDPLPCLLTFVPRVVRGWLAGWLTRDGFGLRHMFGTRGRSEVEFDRMPLPLQKDASASICRSAITLAS